MSRAFFEIVVDALVGFLPPGLRGFSSRISGRNCKIWFGEDARAHFEVQLISGTALRAGGVRARGPAMEIGLHSEHPEAARNDAVLDLLGRRWRRALPDASAGRFIGRQREWRRLSEVWEEVSLSEEEGIEAAERLAAYMRALAPLLR